MELTKENSGNKSLIISEKIPNKAPKKKKILPEDEYIEKMEKIITRDFFPDLPKLRAQNEYLDAVERGDVARQQEMQLTYQLTESTRSRIRSERAMPTVCTPSVIGDTPDVRDPGSPDTTSEDKEDATSSSGCDKTGHRSLDNFLAETTSEDNASFRSVMARSDAAHRQKYPWLYVDENAEKKRVEDALALSPNSAAIEFKKPELVTWKYRNRNALMYVPDGVEWTTEERLLEGDRKEIRHGSTRFTGAPHADDENREAIAEAAALQAKMKEGKVGIDGKEIVPQDSPHVNGYGFVSTPLPEPGVSDTPLMTWGEIEGTPFRLDGGDTPLPQNPSGQQFKIPSLSAREKIALSLVDRAAKKHRKPRPSASPLNSNFGNFGSTASPKTCIEKLLGLSPAAQRLAYAKLGIQRGSDPALRASYSPSPARSPRTPGGGGDKTPATPSSPSPLRTIPTTLPKRHKASDFF